MISINGALAIDIQGQVVADTIAGDQFIGIGGAEDFVAGAGLELSDRSLICLPSTFAKDDETAVADRAVVRRRRGDHDAAPPGRRHRHRVRRRRAGGQDRQERGEALAAIAHPEFRDELLAAAERAIADRIGPGTGGCAPPWGCR